MQPKQIFFDAERMKYPHTGLYHFCWNLGKALIRSCNAPDEQLQLFIPEKERSSFPGIINATTVKPWHKIFLPGTKADVWHATHQDTQYFPYHKKVPVVLTIHDLNYFNDPSKPASKKKAFLGLLKQKVNASDHLTFISRYTLEDLKKYIDINNKPHTVIHNGCNIVEIDDLQQPQHFPVRPFLFTIGTIATKKNFHVLPQLLACNDLLLVFAGITQDASYKQKILQEAKKHNVQDRIIFADAITENDKQWYYKNCEAFVFPSLAEGFGLPVIEAMYFGKPVFLSTATSLPEIGGDVAFYFTSFDKDKMQQTLESGLEQFERHDLSKATKARAEIFSWQNAAKEYLNIYRGFY